MVKLRESGDREAAKKLGVFWHTQGSGKSLSMVFCTQKVLRRLPGKWTFVMVTDRAELDDQIYRTFTGTPLIASEEERTHEVFGDYLSVYGAEEGQAGEELSFRSGSRRR